jgi:streptogrisin C
VDAPSGTYFGIYLQKYSGLSWVNVASGATSATDETLSYNGTAGYYRVRVVAYRGSDTDTDTVDITNP